MLALLLPFYPRIHMRRCRCFCRFTRVPDFRTYAQVQRSHPLAQGNDLHSLLIKPIQRLPRYKLLLEQLHKTCCNAAAAVGGRGVNGAAAAAHATAACVALVDEATIFINERKRDAGKTVPTPLFLNLSAFALVWDVRRFVCLILFATEHLSELRKVKLSFAVQQHRSNASPRRAMNLF
jgi:hypothetical protein